MKLIFLGPPGAGKGTLAGLVAKEMGIPQISTGDIFRDAIKRETELGKQVKAIVGRGDLVPDELTVSLVRERLGAAGRGEGLHPGRVPPHHPPGRGARGVPEARRGGELRHRRRGGGAAAHGARGLPDVRGHLPRAEHALEGEGRLRPLRRPDLHAGRRQARVHHEPARGVQAPDRAADRVLPASAASCATWIPRPPPRRRSRTCATALGRRG